MTACRHTRHVGTCPACQRAQLARWRGQLVEASESVHVSRPRSRASELQWNHAARTQTGQPATLTTF
jgi:Zn ribbon nucleic-acid-binding protein